MIHPSSILRIVDTSIGKHTTCTVEDLVNRYVVKLRNGYIDLSDELIYTRCGFGYTRLFGIIRNEHQADGGWFNLTADNHNMIISGNHVLPSYDMDKPEIIGFHGEVKREFTHKMVQHLPGAYCKPNYSVAIYDQDEKIIKYVRPDVTSVDVDISYMYNVITESGQVDINGIIISATWPPGFVLK